MWSKPTWVGISNLISQKLYNFWFSKIENKSCKTVEAQNWHLQLSFGNRGHSQTTLISYLPLDPLMALVKEFLKCQRWLWTTPKIYIIFIRNHFKITLYYTKSSLFKDWSTITLHTFKISTHNNSDVTS